MSEIRSWLEDLGLGEYADAFEQNEIDLDLARDLNDDTLEKIGIAVAGHRMRILRAVATLVQPAQQTSGPPSPPPGVERRQLTVMFCDLVGSTELSSKLDPEELREVMTAYQKAAGSVIERYGGHVAQYLGDGLMTYFGWPRAHEDDAHRAVRAGLEIVDAVKTLEAPTALSVRVGIATGPVVIGETGYGDASVPKAAVGETPNMAARIQGQAEPDTVAISPSTRGLIGGAFELDGLGPQALKGLVGPVEVFRVICEAATESRFEAQAVGGLTPFVGRETEVAMLVDRWQQAKEGEGQVVLLEGEPGIGKSRITQVLRERIANEAHVRLRYQCSPYYTNSAFYPIIEQLGRAAGIARDDTPDQKLDKLETALALSTDDVADVAPLIAAMLSLPIDRYAPLNLSAQKQKERTVEALANQVAGLAKPQPVLAIFEDAHWVDPTTLEALGEVIARIDRVSVLLVVTFRPEFKPPWSPGGFITAHTLTRLPRRMGADMVAKVSGGKSLPDDVLDQIVAKTDGVPLFVEELTKTVLEAGYLKDAGDHYELDGSLPPLAIPSTLQDSLMARLDRLSPVKEIAQIGACIGREFAYELVAGVSSLRGNELEDALQQLVNSELIFRRGSPPDSTYSFKHALVQDSAYESLLKSTRHQIHRKIAEMLERDFGNGAGSAPELIAHHYTAAGLSALAVPYWLRAGQNAYRDTALAEAEAHLTKGLAVSEALPVSESKERNDLALRSTLGSVCMALKGWPHQSVYDNFSIARALCQKHGDTKQLLPILWGLMGVPNVRADYKTSMGLAAEMIEVGQSAQDTALEVTGHMAMCIPQGWCGDFAAAKRSSDSVFAIYDFNSHKRIVHEINHDPICGTNAWRSHFLWMQGWPDKAKQTSLDQLVHARQLAHPFNLIFSLLPGAGAFHYRRELEPVLRWADEALALGQEQGIPIAASFLVPGWRSVGLVQCGQFQEGYEQMLGATEAWQAIEGRCVLPLWWSMMSEALGAMGRTGEALSLIDQALHEIAATGERWFEAEAHRIKGELTLMTDRSKAQFAGACFNDALTVARAQSAKGWELRASISLARLLGEQGERQKAYDLLLPIYDWFTEGFETADLVEAKALLDDLR